MQAFLRCSKDKEVHLSAMLQLHKDKLAEGLKVAKDLEKFSSGRDKVILKDISELREASENRLLLI